MDYWNGCKQNPAKKELQVSTRRPLNNILMIDVKVILTIQSVKALMTDNGIYSKTILLHNNNSIISDPRLGNEISNAHFSTIAGYFGKPDIITDEDTIPSLIGQYSEHLIIIETKQHYAMIRKLKNNLPRSNVENQLRKTKYLLELSKYVLKN